MAQGFEVDFLARYPSGAEELIQVSADAVGRRALRALAEAGPLFPNARRKLLTLTGDGLPAQVPAHVEAQPAYVWMLGRSREQVT